MKKIIQMLALYFFILTAFIFIAVAGSDAVTVISEGAPFQRRSCVVIDAGHGGIDGGTTSCNGVLESMINLQIAEKLNDLFHLLGVQTVMVRTGDYSIHSSGSSIAQIKVSDLKERVKLVNKTDNAILVSIHQNYYPDDRYSGAQVFYAGTNNSDTLAEQMQNGFRTLDSGNKRLIKKADGIYLMQHIQCPGVLVECGFLSNHEEEAKLKTKEYQQRICCVIACTTSQFLTNTM